MRIIFLFLFFSPDVWSANITEPSKLFQCVDQLSSQGRPGTPIATSQVMTDALGQSTVKDFITPLGRPVANGYLFESGPRQEGQAKRYITLDKEMVRLCQVPVSHHTFLLSFNRDTERVRTTHKLQLEPEDKDFIAIGSTQTYNGQPVPQVMGGVNTGPTDRQYIRNTRTTCGLIQDSCYLDYQPRCETIPMGFALHGEELSGSAREQAQKIRQQLEILTSSMLRRLLESLPESQQRDFNIQKHLRSCDMDFIQRAITNFKNEKGYIFLEPMNPNPNQDSGNDFIQ